MASPKNFFLFLFCIGYLILCSHGLMWAPCPFNTQFCNCSLSDPPSNITFQHAICDSQLLPNFTSLPDHKYSINDELVIKYNVREIPAKHFLAFQLINHLKLIQSTTPKPLASNWDHVAFFGVQIRQLTVVGLADLVPPPPAMDQLKDNLTTFSIINGGNPLQLNDFAFTSLGSLAWLEIQNTPIERIGDNAFAHLDNLRSIDFYSASLKVFPPPLTKLVNLFSLNLANNLITEIPDGTFSNLTQLKFLALDGNPLRQAVENGLLNRLPKSIFTLGLENMSLTQIPSASKNSLFSLLFLSQNQIATIRSNDLQGYSALEQLHLDQNPITNIEKGAFSPLKLVAWLSLNNILMKSIDLSIFEGLGSNATDAIDISLTNSQFLQTLTVSDIDKVADKSQVWISNSSLVTIDSKIDQLLKKKTNVKIDISTNVNLNCTGCAWMAYYVTCTQQLIITDSTCADQGHRSLGDYLKSVQPNPNCPTKGAAHMASQISLIALLSTLAIFIRIFY